ncbi:hypothetical protein [Spirosoma validum]|uniref:Uncharacterized protein n=1 Tax=Spirosoma validum TaxID=2771355 RepID=A0A927GHP5_9BACT|nr:hypothetical protein [Spirosoma validum]MBD2757870.1 hypothetical protein [Spirosoma validum]
MANNWLEGEPIRGDPDFCNSHVTYTTQKMDSSMADNWRIFPPISIDPNSGSPGSEIRLDFEITDQTNEFENIIGFDWSGLSRQELGNVSNLKKSQELKELLFSYNYGISWGMAIDTLAKEDPNDAECGFSIHSKNAITETSIQEIVSLIKSYKVH